MIYSDLIFILVIFPVVTVFSLFDRSSEYKNLILILCSILFFTWGHPLAIGLIFVSALFDWLFGSMAEKGGTGAKTALVLDLVMNLGLLTFFAHNYLFKSIPSLSLSEQVLPIGVGFYTLRGFSYVYDVYKGKISKEKNFFCLLTYMVSFHLMVAGPLVRYGDIEPQIRSREITGAKINSGLVKIVIGLGKAVILAKPFAQIFRAGLESSEITILGSWLGMLSFFAKYYFIFTGLSDMACGLGLVNGFEYPKNYTDIEAKGLFTGMVKSFNTTVIDFFAEIFGLKNDKKGAGVLFFTLMCGIFTAFWYEAKVSFIIAGLIAALIIWLEKLFLGKILSKLPSFICRIYQILTAMFVFGLTAFDSLNSYKNWLGTLVGMNTQYTLSVAVKNGVLNNIILIIVSLLVVSPFFKNKIVGAVDKFSGKSVRNYGIVRVSKTILTAVLLLMCIITISAGYAA